MLDERTENLGVAVAVCTRDRPDELRRCLRSLVDASEIREVLVSDDGSDPRTAQAVREFESVLPRLKLLSGPRRGLAANRNSCIDAATAEYLLFLDDDAWLAEDFLAHALVRAAPDRLVTGFEQRSAMRVSSSNPSFLGFLENPPNGEFRSIVINSTVFPTKFLKRTYFDEFLRYGSEETEIAFAARFAGLGIVQIQAGNHHEHSSLGREQYDAEATRSRAYVSARRYLHYRHRPELYLLYLVAAVVNTGLYALKTSGLRSALRMTRAVVEGAVSGARRRPRRLSLPSGGGDAACVSLVIPTWRRPDRLEACLYGIQRLGRAPDEIVVVRREEDSAAATVIARHKSSVPVREVVVSAEGQVAALEAGARASRGDIVVFIDDDTVPQPTWLDFLLQPYTDPRVGAVGGRDIVHPSGPEDVRKRRTVGRVRWFGRVVGNHHLGTGGAREVDVLKGANASFRREALAFPRGLRGSGAQVANDLAMSLAARAAGWKVVYDPRAEVDHFPGPRFDRDQRGGQGRAAFADAVFNRWYVLDSLRPGIGLARVAYGICLGDRSTPGLARAVAGAAGNDRSLLPLLRPSIAAQREARRAARREPLSMIALVDGPPAGAPS